MRSSRLLHRALAASLAVLFAMAVGGQAVGARSCPHHGVPEADVAADSEDGNAGASNPADRPDRPCNCIGTCHPGATAAPPTTASLSTPVAPAVRNAEPATPYSPLAPFREPGFLLHLPNAPPA